MVHGRHLILPLLFLLALPMSPRTSSADFSFLVTSDQRKYAGNGAYDTSTYFRGVLEAAARTGSSQFMVSPGDIDQPGDSFYTIGEILGSSYQWFPVVGNHELPSNGTEPYSGANMEWLRSFDYDVNGTGLGPDIVNSGPSGCPETTFSFDYANTHLIIVNEYCDDGGDDVTTGDIPDHLYNWLAADLAATSKEHILVFGHEPAYPQPDIDNGRFRHQSDSLNASPTNRDRFWALLKTWGVAAYFCGHTHNFSIARLDGIWQIDSGHARGMGDTGAASTFVRMDVGSDIRYTVYRDNHDGLYDYTDIIHRGTIAGLTGQTSMSFQDGVAPEVSYSGTRDTNLSQSFPNKNFGTDDILKVDGDDPGGTGKDLSALLIWDIYAIPAGSTVLDADITVQVKNTSGDAYIIQGLDRNWDENEGTWNRATSLLTWQQPGATGPEDRVGTLLAASAPGRKGELVLKLNTNGLALIQSWIDHPPTNHGLIISGSTSANGFDFASREYPVPEQRPRLTVRFRPRPSFNATPLPWLHLLLGK